MEVIYQTLRDFRRRIKKKLKEKTLSSGIGRGEVIFNQEWSEILQKFCKNIKFSGRFTQHTNINAPRSIFHQL